MVPVDLTEGFAAFPEPSFSWTRNGQPFTAPGLNYSTVVFDNVKREDAGNYNVSATNFILNSTTEQVGNDTGSFYLDVLCKLCCICVVNYQMTYFIMAISQTAQLSRCKVQHSVMF